MNDNAPRRYYFDGVYSLTYTRDGWALLHKDDGLVGTDSFPSALNVPYGAGGTLLEFVKEVMAKGLGTPL